ncbi:MAG TPA: response regulator [Bacteroidia bacterium]|jgi:DNA-binding LytR/AlgR family response regulator|nr:response regulator [Bacteroidia bacterium]
MPNKLIVITVTDDPVIAEEIKTFTTHSTVATIARNFERSEHFLEQLPMVNFDYCIIDADIADAKGLAVAQMLNEKPFIIVTDGEKAKLKNVVHLSPLEIILKPLTKEKLDKAYGKAHKLLAAKREYGLFRVAEFDNRITLRIEEIAVIVTDELDARNKNLFMKNGNHYTLMDYSMKELLEMSPVFVQINRATVVNIDVVHEVMHDMATLKLSNSAQCAKHATIGQCYKNSFLARFFHR